MSDFVAMTVYLRPVAISQRSLRFGAKEVYES